MLYQMTRDEIVELYSAGGVLGRSAPFGDWWLYPADFRPGMARIVDPTVPREMEANGELSITYGDPFVKIWVMELKQAEAA